MTVRWRVRFAEAVLRVPVFVKIMGIVDYITKPFSPEAITAVVSHTISKYARERLEECGDATAIAWLPRDKRYIEKLATPDVTVADLCLAWLPVD